MNRKMKTLLYWAMCSMCFALDSKSIADADSPSLERLASNIFFHDSVNQGSPDDKSSSISSVTGGVSVTAEFRSHSMKKMSVDSPTGSQSMMMAKLMMSGKGVPSIPTPTRPTKTPIRPTTKPTKPSTSVPTKAPLTINPTKGENPGKKTSPPRTLKPTACDQLSKGGPKMSKKSNKDPKGKDKGKGKKSGPKGDKSKGKGGNDDFYGKGKGKGKGGNDDFYGKGKGKGKGGNDDFYEKGKGKGKGSGGYATCEPTPSPAESISPTSVPSSPTLASLSPTQSPLKVTPMPIATSSKKPTNAPQSAVTSAPTPVVTTISPVLSPSAFPSASPLIAPTKAPLSGQTPSPSVSPSAPPQSAGASPSPSTLVPGQSASPSSSAAPTAQSGTSVSPSQSAAPSSVAFNSDRPSTAPSAIQGLSPKPTSSSVPSPGSQTVAPSTSSKPSQSGQSDHPSSAPTKASGLPNTTSESPSASFAPSTPSVPTKAPTGQAPPTMAPTLLLLRSVTPFTITYTTTGADPQAADFAQAEDITLNYLDEYFKATFDLVSTTSLDAFTGTTTNTSLNPVSISFQAELNFTTSSEAIPTTEQLDTLVSLAFQPPNVQTLLLLLGSLPPSNPFSTTSNAVYSTGLVARSAEQSSTPSMGHSVVALALISMVFVGGFVFAKRKSSKTNFRYEKAIPHAGPKTGDPIKCVDPKGQGRSSPQYVKLQKGEKTCDPAADQAEGDMEIEFVQESYEVSREYNFSFQSPFLLTNGELDLRR